MRFEEGHEGITALNYQALLPTVYGCTTKLATLRKDKEGCTRSQKCTLITTAVCAPCYRVAYMRTKHTNKLTVTVF